ncbi:MAG: hypothetical protein FJ276_24575 [Planctomycetes bacterium]|nr:hypothetical protein [Planctomycetota bacterium]
MNFDVLPPEDAVEQCIAAHVAVGIHHLVWAIGRATIDYHPSNPDHILLGGLGSSLGSEDWSPVFKLMQRQDTFRRAIAVSRDRGMTFWGRLGMNRHYGHEQYIAATSRFSREHPQFRERSRGGHEDIGRLCYAFDEVQAERLDIIAEVRELGVDGLVLDYCRQPPITRYHPRWVELFQKSGGEDPHSWPAPTLEQLLPWYQFRAGVMTEFMRKVRKQLYDGEAKAGRPCPVIARVSATSLLSDLAAGLDLAAWLRDDLVDGIMLSPLVFCPQARDLVFEDHVKLAHQHGKVCIGGLGSLELIRNHVPTNTGFFRPEPMYRLLALQYAAGVDAMSVYQTDTLARIDYLREHLPLIGDPAAVKARAVTAKDEQVSPWLGYDWHTSREGRFAGYELASAVEQAL